MIALLEEYPIARRPMSSSDWMISFVVILLAVAASLKLWAFATTPSFEAHWTDSWFVIVGGSGFEILLASWLASGWGRRTANFVATGFFLFITCIVANKWWSGDLSCGCFGTLKVFPWITTILDVGILTGLLWQLFSRRIRSSPVSKIRIATVFVLGISTALVSPVIAYHFHPVAFSTGGITESGGFIVLEPEKWVGEQFPLIPYITIQHPIEHGACRVVLFHSDCSDCQRLLPQIEHFARMKALRTVLVELPPVAPLDRSIVPSGTVCEMGTLDSSKEWFATAPVIIDLVDGRVVRQQSGSHAEP